MAMNELLILEVSELIHAEGQLVDALPRMEDAAAHPKLKEAFQEHLLETELQIARLHTVLQSFDESASPRPCEAMSALIAEAIEKIESVEDDIRDLAIIAMAQKIEHHEIAAYGTIRALARQLGDFGGAKLLSFSLGEEQRADYRLTAIAETIMQETTLKEINAAITLARTTPSRKKRVEGSLVRR